MKTFIKEQNKVQPFELVIMIENKDDLLDLLGRFHFSYNEVKNELDKTWKNNFEFENTKNWDTSFLLRAKAEQFNLIDYK